MSTQKEGKTKIIQKVKLTYKMTLLTGLHIGGSKDLVEIGGIDLPVVRSPLKGNQPYIPGSSLKGKLRALLEYSAGATDVGKSANILINKLFGITEKKNGDKIEVEAQRTRLIVRDAYLTDESAKKLDSTELPMPYTEVKFENTINRITGTAEHPRQIERIPANAEFDVEFILTLFELQKENGDIVKDNKQDYLDLLKKGIKLLEADYLGGSGTRGYGQVEFKEIKEETLWPDDKKSKETSEQKQD